MNINLLEDENWIKGEELSELNSPRCNYGEYYYDED